MELISLPSIFKDTSLTSGIPAYFKNTQPHPQLLSWLKTHSCSVRVKVFSNSSMDHHVKQINHR